MTTEKTAKKPRAKKAAAPETFVAYKGFDKNLQCRGYQYEVGKTYLHTGPVRQCESGFHACQNPLDVLDFYDFRDGNRFAKVLLGGKVDRSDNKKWAAAELTVSVELKLPDLIADTVRWAMDACKSDKLSGGNVTSGHSTTNASSGHYATNASSGDYAKNASSGDYAKNASSGHYAKNASSGDYAKNASSGDWDFNSATGEHAVLCGAGRETQYKGAKGVWISAAEYTKIDGKRLCCGFAVGQAGYGDVPADTWLIAKGGKLVPA